MLIHLADWCHRQRRLVIVSVVAVLAAASPVANMPVGTS